MIFFPCVVFFPFLSLRLCAECVDVFFVVVYFTSNPNAFRIKVSVSVCRVVLGRFGGRGGGGKRDEGCSMHAHLSLRIKND